TRVRIGFVGSMLFRGLPEKLARFRASHPQVQTELVELNSAEQLHALGRHQIDLGFVHTPSVQSELTKALYMSEPFVLCTREQGGARARAPRLQALAREPLVLFSRGASPDYYERVLSLCAQLGLDPTFRHEVRHWLSVVALVARGMGYALVPRSLEGSGISGVQFSRLPATAVSSDVYMVWNERKMPAVLPEMIAFFQPR
ncbi:MAG TPA: LysR substrate-binding domain-containing protein, partial [Ramlibacter sp.]|uniref:LysR substrate-binding domain-containing protein n=1 Tax=Ramlibacter sp. TaxID=1917967 RepID=UPI002D802BD5